MGLVVYLLRTAHRFAVQVQISTVNFFWRSGTPTSKQEESICEQLYSFFIFLAVFSLFLSYGCPCAILFIFYWHAVLFVSMMLPCLTFYLPSLSCILSNCHSMPRSSPLPFVLSLYHVTWYCTITRKCGQIFIILIKEENQKLFFFCSTQFLVCEPVLQLLSSEWTASISLSRWFSISIWNLAWGGEKEVLLWVVQFCCQEQ